MIKELISSEIELNALLSLPVVKLQNLDFLINRENKTIDLKISFNNHVSLIFVNIQGIELTDQFNYGNVEDEFHIFLFVEIQNLFISNLTRHVIRYCPCIHFL